MDTSPSYYISYCKLEHIDCRRFWRKKLTLSGVCIVFDPLIAVEQHKALLDDVTDMKFEVG